MKDTSVKNQNKPLATLLITCYNQEWCIADSLSAAFAQTYSPLEIVIVDDCSKDKTWLIVNSMVDAYRKEDGRHKIVLRQNDVNSYTSSRDVKLRIREELIDLYKGEMIVQADGDDISEANRVEVIMDDWIKGGKKKDLFYSSAKKIDLGGRIIGRRSCYDCISGSSLAYTKRMLSFFGPCKEEFLHGDVVRKYQAEMLGGLELIDEELVRYRICGGYSQALGSFRKPMLRNYQCLIGSFRQLLSDVERIKEVDSGKYKIFSNLFEEELQKRQAELPLWESDKVCERIKAFLSLNARRRFLSGMVLYAPILLLPHKVSDPILDALHSIVVSFKRKLGK